MPAATPQWDELSPERQAELIASGWPPNPIERLNERWSFNVCLDCGGLTENIDGQKPHPAWPRCECPAAAEEASNG